MKNFLETSKERYYLSLGEYKFSPIMEASIALSLSYRDLHLKNNQKFPFYLSFPDKNLASIWLSTSLLINFFFEDYINQTGAGEIDSFESGNKVEIFGVVAEIESISNEKIFLKFSDQGSIPINKKLRTQINKTKKTLVNKFSLFIRKYKESKKNRNPISKILELSEPIIINENYLTSKVLLVTGRGNANKLRSILKSSHIYDEPLNKIFIENKNLIIKKDLEAFKNIFNPAISDNERLFKVILIDFLVKTNEVEIELRTELMNLLEFDKFLTISFKDKFEDLIEIHSHNFPELKQINDLYPGVREALPENLKAVVINEIEQVDLYNDTIKGFLNAGIPVLIISDRYVQNTVDLTFLNNFFNKTPLAYRINWNRKKINALNEISNCANEYLDKILWKNCLRYSKQNIKINVCESSPLDKFLFESQKIVKTLEAFETIQEAYYKHLYPAMYLFKNSMVSTRTVFELAERFDIVLQKNKIYLEKAIQILLQETVEFLKNVTANTKIIEDFNTTFSNLLPVQLDRKIFIPANSNRINVPDENSKSIDFSGYPYNEFSGKYLISAVCSDFVPEIGITCWPIESELTYNYLKRRVLAGYFTDNLHPDWKIPKEIILADSEDFLSEVKTFLKYEKINLEDQQKESTAQEDDILAITNFKYKGYSNSSEAGNSYRVKCNILNFSDGSFLFLPKNSKILAQIETDDGSLKFRNSLFSDLEIGFIIFKYKKDKKEFRGLAKNDLVIKNAFSELEFWKTLLMKMYSDNNLDIEKVENILLNAKGKNQIIGGNPLKHNIQRWLFDEELIAPEIENIRIILFASERKEIDKELEIIKTAKSKVEGYSISLSSKIKNSISKKIEKQFSSNEKNFELEVNHVQIDVESRIITGLEKSDIEIEYHNTRKILI